MGLFTREQLIWQEMFLFTKYKEELKFEIILINLALKKLKKKKQRETKIKKIKQN